MSDMLTAKIHAFPSCRHATMVRTIGDRMATRPSIDEAEKELVAHLEFHWDRLEAFGVGDAEIELECRRFSRAAWGQYQKVQHEEPGAA